MFVPKKAAVEADEAAMLIERGRAVTLGFEVASHIHPECCARAEVFAKAKRSACGQ